MQSVKVMQNCSKEFRGYQLTGVSPCIASRPTHAGQIILDLKEDKLYSECKQENEDDNMVSTHCQPPVTASQKVVSEFPVI
jgi:hypothetical protein